MAVARTHFRIDPMHAAITATACWSGFALVCWLVWSGRSAGLDENGLLFWRAGADFQAGGPPWLPAAVRTFTDLGDVPARMLAIGAALVGLAMLHARRAAALLMLTICSGWIANTALKAALARPRPQIVPHLTETGGMSFPSGHSFNSALVYFAIALTFAAMSPCRAVRRTVIGMAALLSLLIALSRVWLGVHWPSDAAAGWLGGAGWAFAASALFHRTVGSVADRSSHEDTKMSR